MQEKNNQQDVIYADANSIANMFGYSPNTLARWRSEKRNFPYYIIKGSVRYKIEEVKDIVERGRVNICA